jgi:hypothetical protein
MVVTELRGTRIESRSAKRLIYLKVFGVSVDICMRTPEYYHKIDNGRRPMHVGCAAKSQGRLRNRRRSISVLYQHCVRHVHHLSQLLHIHVFYQNGSGFGSTPVFRKPVFIILKDNLLFLHSHTRSL